jgi:hypothetical protein
MTHYTIITHHATGGGRYDDVGSGERPSSPAAHDKHHCTKTLYRLTKIARVPSRASGQVQRFVGRAD